jgi:uncharacterized protein YunC (DUF1805 family)
MTTLDPKVVSATVVERVKHATLPGVYVKIEKRFHEGKWDEGEVQYVQLPIGTKYSTNSMTVKTVTESDCFHYVSHGEKRYFMVPGSTKVYLITRAGVHPSKNNNRAKTLQKFVQLKTTDIPKVLSKLKSSKAVFTKTNNERCTLLILNNKYIYAGCAEGFDRLLQEKIINSNGKIIGTKVSEEFINRNLRDITNLLEQVGVVYAQTT